MNPKQKMDDCLNNFEKSKGKHTKLIFDLAYLNENEILSDELPKQIIVESDVVPREGDTIDFDDNEPYTVDEVRFRYTKNSAGEFEFQDVYVFLKLP